MTIMVSNQGLYFVVWRLESKELGLRMIELLLYLTGV